MSGPLINDFDFFTKVVDASLPGLERIEEAVSRRDFKAARILFAEYAKTTVKPELYFQLPGHEVRPSFLLPGETESAAAERILQLRLISTGTPHQFEGKVDWFANPTYNQYKEWTWQLNRHHDWEVLAKRYIATGDERYAECFVRMFQSWVEQAVVPENLPGSETLCWRTIEAGIRMSQSWPLAQHTFYNSPHFTEDVLTDWYKSVWEHGVRLRHFHRHGNWLVMEMNGLLHISLLYPMFKDAKAWKDYALERLAEELSAQMYPDGFQYELSTGYHQVVLSNYYRLIGLCRAYSEPAEQELAPRLEDAFGINVKLMMPDGRLPDLNDGSWAKVQDLMEPAVELFPERKDFLWARTAGREGEAPPETSIGLPYAGYYIMRSGWTSDAVWALFDAGPFGRGHQHEDKLNLLIHAYGELLLTEGGNYAYDSSEMRRYILSTKAHNTTRVDGQDQNRRKNYAWEHSDIARTSGSLWHTCSAYDMAEGIYDEGYGPEAKRSVVHKRKVIFMKNNSRTGPCFIVIDRLYPADTDTHSHHYEILWQLRTESVELRNMTASSLNMHRANISIVPAENPNLGVEIVRGRTDPDWQGWKPIQGGLQGQYSPTPTVIYRLTAEGPVRVVTLLYPIKPGESTEVTQVQAESDVQANEIQLTLRDGSSLTISENDFQW